MMTNNHDGCECKVHGWTLTFLLSNYACQYIVLSKYDPELCNDKKSLFLGISINVESNISFGLLEFSYIFYNLCANL